MKSKSIPHLLLNVKHFVLNKRAIMLLLGPEHETCEVAVGIEGIIFLQSNLIFGQKLTKICT